MRILTKKLAFVIIKVFFLVSVSFSQGIIEGFVHDIHLDENKPFVSLALIQDGEILQSTTTDYEGYYYFDKVDRGIYSIKINGVGAEKTFTNVHVDTEDLFLSLDMDFTNTIPITDVIHYKDLITKEYIKKIDDGFIKNTGARIITNVEKLQSTAVETPNGISYKGARPGTSVYYIDGIRTYGELYIPMSSVKDIEIYSGGIPAQYGNTTSAVIVVETKSYFDNL
ncbi:MAG: TonB-dependent receptor plug domain-containing protein [Chitinophagales bacterium]|nr:TonB-dependent receptor plug domain-containing protein [Chitinophagales bacterium]